MLSGQGAFDLMLCVKERTMGADGVVVLTLESRAVAELPAWQAGAHIDVMPGPGLVRQYSLCGNPANRQAWQIAVLLEPAGRGGSAAVHQRLHEGAEVWVRGPRNHFAFDAADSYVFIAGGIGITPLLPMIATAERAGKEWTLHYGGRSRSTMAFVDMLERTYGDRVSIRQMDEAGPLKLDSLLSEPNSNTLVYCCGPESLLLAVEERCASWPSGALRVERFTARKSDQQAPNESFEVELSKSALNLSVPPDQSILDVVRAAGIQVLSSCEEGTCGTCETKVLGGTPDHRDSLLTEEERAANETMMLCVSRSLGARLVLEL